MADELELVHVDLEDGLPAGAAVDRRLVLWRGGVPVGSVDAPAAAGSGAALADAIAYRVAEAGDPSATREASPVRAAVAIRSAGDGGRLERCRAAVAAGSLAPAAVLVVGPGAGTEAMEGAADVVAFVDEALEPHPRWLERLCAPFADPDVAAVGGPALERGRVPAGHPPPALGAHGPGPAELPPGPATLAVRPSAVRHVGLWDVRLIPEARDRDLWNRLLAARWRCRYAPGAVAFHDGPIREDRAAAARGALERLLVEHARTGARKTLARALAGLPATLAGETARELAGRARAAVGLTAPGVPAPVAAALAGYARGLRGAGLATAPPQPQGRAPLPAFLAHNPFGHPHTDGFFYREKMRAIHRVAPDVAAAEVLEVGGGRSGLAGLLYPEAQVTTIDMDPEHAASPVHQGPRSRFVVADATDLPFPDGAFDVVTMLDVLEHIPDDRAAAHEAWRVLRPGGHLIASSPNEHWRSPYHRVMAPFCPDDEEMIARWLHVRRGYTIADYAALFGRVPDVRADFINPVTVVCHDLAFSHLPTRVRRGLAAAIAPVTWLGYALQPRGARGTESAVSWRKPAA